MLETKSLLCIEQSCRCSPLEALELSVLPHVTRWIRFHVAFHHRWISKCCFQHLDGHPRYFNRYHVILPIRSVTWRFYEKRKGLIEWCQTNISLLTGSSSCFFLVPETYLALYEPKYQHFLFKELKNQAPCCIFTGKSEKSEDGNAEVGLPFHLFCPCLQLSHFPQQAPTLEPIRSQEAVWFYVFYQARLGVSISI